MLDLAGLAAHTPAFNEQQAADTIDLLEERLAELELALEDEGWLLIALVLIATYLAATAATLLAVVVGVIYLT